MSARDQYLTQLRSDYIGADKQTKTRLLNEAEKRTKLARKYLIAKLRPDAAPRPSKPKRRRATYGPAIKTALAQLWPIFDYPCGQRFAPILRMEVDRLRALGEIHVSDAVAAKLKKASPKTVDRLLRGERQRLQLNRYRNPAVHPLLYQQIPVKVPSEWDREQIGNLQVDFVLHCGQSSAGLFAVTLSAADIASGWWEASAMLGRSQHGTHTALEAMCERLPFRCTKSIPTTTAASSMSWCTTGAASTTSPCHDLGLCKRTITRGSSNATGLTCARSSAIAASIPKRNWIYWMTYMPTLPDTRTSSSRRPSWFRNGVSKASCIECMKHRKHPLSDCSNPGS
jgi:hypothetical protein